MAQVAHESMPENCATVAERVGIHSVQSQFGRSADCSKLADGMIRFLLCMLKRSADVDGHADAVVKGLLHFQCALDA